jgi:hypothetical protein
MFKTTLAAAALLATAASVHAEVQMTEAQYQTVKAKADVLKDCMRPAEQWKGYSSPQDLLMHCAVGTVAFLDACKAVPGNTEAMCLSAATFGAHDVITAAGH